MRPLILCFSLALVASSVLPSAADAARKGSRAGAHGKAYGYKSYGNSPSYGYGAGTAAPAPSSSDDSMDCIRARDADPGGTYSGYPCWAQWALSPKGRAGN